MLTPFEDPPGVSQAACCLFQDALNVPVQPVNQPFALGGLQNLLPAVADRVKTVWLSGFVDGGQFAAAEKDEEGRYETLVLWSVLLQPRGAGLAPTRAELTAITRSLTRSWNLLADRNAGLKDGPVAVLFRYDVKGHPCVLKSQFG